MTRRARRGELGGDAAAQLGRARLLAGAGVLVQRAALDGLVDQPDQLRGARPRQRRRRHPRRQPEGGGSTS